MLLSNQDKLTKIRNRIKQIDGFSYENEEELKQLYRDEAELLRPKSPRDIPVYDCVDYVPTSSFEIGHYIEWRGIVGRVEQIGIIRDEFISIMPIYSLKCSYVGGDFDLYNKLISASMDQNGFKDYLFEVHGSDLFFWNRCFIKSL
ncbi:hypothetical protein QPB19_003509 [Vibrio cholerae]|nr:hypothetical protein [Vibrio cholerae]